MTRDLWHARAVMLGAIAAGDRILIRRGLIRRGLAGPYPESVDAIITALEATAQGWNAAPPPFTWGGRRAARRQRARERRHRLGDSGACTTQPVRRRCLTVLAEWQQTGQLTH